MTVTTIKLIETYAQINFVTEDGEAWKIADKNGARIIRTHMGEDVAINDLSTEFTGKELVTVYNSIIDQLDEAGAKTALDTTKRFSTTAAGAKRVVKALIELKAAWANWDAAETAEEPAEAPKPAPKPAEAPKPAPKPAPKDGERKVRALKDKIQPPAAKIYEFRSGTVGKAALDLLSREGGIHVDEFIQIMNGVAKEGSWTRGNTWSSLRYILHTNKGYGIQMIDEVLSLVTE